MKKKNKEMKEEEEKKEEKQIDLLNAAFQNGQNSVPRTEMPSGHRCTSCLPSDSPHRCGQHHARLCIYCECGEVVVLALMCVQDS